MERHTVEGEPRVDATIFLKMVKNTVIRKLQEKDNIELKIVLVCLMEKPNPSRKNPEVKEAHFSDKTTTKLLDNDVDKMYDEASEKNIREYVKISERRKRLAT